MLTAENIHGQFEFSTVVMKKHTGKQQIRGELKLHEPMSRHTSWRVGGLADQYYVPADIEDLSIFLSDRKPGELIIWLGLGSNLLVRDGGIRGTVIAVSGVLGEIEVSGKQIIKVGAGVTCNKFARYTANAGLSGVEFLAGIPGTIGGALTMNAGAFGGETWDYVISAETMDRSGRLNVRNRNDFDIEYRFVGLPPDEWFISARFQLLPDVSGEANAKIREYLARRSDTQPTGESSCGSVFRNPPGDHAGRLIDACGLKGARVGKARVSEKHANFIINDGGASAADIEELIETVRVAVKEKTGVVLEPEVRIIGEAG